MYKRKLRDNLPVLHSKLNQTVQVGEGYKIERNKKKCKVAFYYNKRHNVSKLSELQVNDKVWVTDLKSYGVIKDKCKEPRAFIVKTCNGTYRRNRWHLVPAPHVKLSDVEDDYSMDDYDYVQLASPGDSPGDSQEPLLDSNSPGQQTNNLDNKSVDVNEHSHDTEQNNRRSRRPVRKPAYLNDYVCH